MYHANSFMSTLTPQHLERGEVVQSPKVSFHGCDAGVWLRSSSASRANRKGNTVGRITVLDQNDMGFGVFPTCIEEFVAVELGIFTLEEVSHTMDDGL
jgi:hypothetical protein